ncbi:EamA family transporter [Actinokineospora guangxiensis]|uniref:EamA family transporter n=1 Tax=Actinokineospora guangxiensis TaxID=1490288 RepID=A0ABW0ERN1_9PSEU
MSPNRSKIFLACAGLLWGTGGLAGALLHAHTGLHPVAVAAYRLLIGGVVATAALVALRVPAPRSRPAILRLLTAGTLLGLFQAGHVAAVTLTSVGLATLLTIGSAPIFAALASGDRSRRTVTAVALSVFGLALLAGSPAVEAGWQAAAGVALSLATGAVFATLTLVTRRPVEGLTSGTTTAWGLLIGGVLLLPIALPIGLTATTLAILLLDDPVTPFTLVGAACLAAALLLNATTGPRLPTSH